MTTQGRDIKEPTRTAALEIADALGVPLTAVHILLTEANGLHEYKRVR